MNMKKRMAMGACFLLTFVFSGCGLFFDASDFVEACLDLGVKQDASRIEEYIDDPQEIEEMKGSMSKQWDEMLETQFKGTDVPEDVQQEYRDLILDLLKNAKYTAVEDEKTKDGYEVQVDIEPITGVFANLETPVREACAAYFEENKEDIRSGLVTQENVEDAVYQIFFDVLREKMENLTYGDKRTVTVDFAVNDDKEFDVHGAEEAGEQLVDFSGSEDFNLWDVWWDVIGMNAAGYVEAALDIGTKGSTDTFVAYLGDAGESLQEEYSQYVSESIRQAFGDAEVSEEAMQELEEAMRELLKKARYTVGEAKETKDGYAVDVSVETVLGAFGGLKESMENELMAYGQANAEGIANGTVTDADINSAIYSILAKIVKENIGKAQYAEPQTVTVNVEKAEDGYELSEEDMEKVSELLIDYTGMEELL